VLAEHDATLTGIECAFSVALPVINSVAQVHDSIIGAAMSDLLHPLCRRWPNFRRKLFLQDTQQIRCEGPDR
jgi:hypothetical protein